ncbi:putative RNA recognition motif domain, mei2/Mei2-like RNA recognition [Helianthus annuus]|nr:putative RNA recognition motif domain, mei2/Mei2-like RNA recognition [Helianthus annuus]
MPVAIEDPYDTYRTKFPCEEHVGKSTLKADNNVTCLEEKRSLICTKQSQTIENLLPDEEDLFSGVLDELGCTAATNSDDEDSDLFTSNGGIELEENSKLYFGQWKSMVSEGLNTDQSSSDYIVSYEQHPSRTLLVENVDKRVEDSKLRGLFEQHGDIQTFYTTCRCQGFVIISYYDIRAATIALNTLQNKPLENENLHIRYLNPEDDTLGQYIDQASLEVFSSDTSISNDKLHQLFGSFGDIEDIRGTTHHKHIKYYDIRAAEAAINGLGSSNTLQESKLEVNYPKREVNYAREQHGIMQDQLRSCQNLNGNSLPQVVTSCMKDEYIYGVPALLQSSCSFTRTYDKHLHMLGPYGPTTGHMFWGSTRMMRSALGEHANALSCSNSFQNHHLNPVILSSCPPFNNSVCVHTGSKSMKCSFSRPKGRARRISYGRHGHVSCHTDDKKFELDIERVLRGEDSRTTLMIRNIPNKYSSAMLLAAINEHNQGTYDFIYLPLDFKNKCNMGYAFINMTDPLQIVPFYKSINGKKWEKFHSGKVACLAYARIQGKQALIANFQESSLMNQDKCCHPILFTTDGPNAGNQEPFPLGPKIHSRRYKNRCNTHKRNENQEISSTSLEGESYYRI